jgi:hypothetical protein
MLIYAMKKKKHKFNELVGLRKILSEALVFKWVSGEFERELGFHCFFARGVRTWYDQCCDEVS